MSGCEKYQKKKKMFEYIAEKYIHNTVGNVFIYSTF